MDKLVSLSKRGLLRTSASFDVGRYFAVYSQKLVRSDYVLSLLLFCSSVLTYLILILLTDGKAVALSVGGTWFQSDGWRVFDDMIVFEATHFRDKVHPLFSITAIPATTALRALPGISAIDAIYVINGVCFALAVVLVFATARTLVCSRLDSILLVILFATSAASIFWFTVPETYPAGCVAILLSLLLLAMDRARDRYLIIAGVFTLGTTITNWIAALTVAGLTRPLGRLLFVAVASFGLVAAGALLAKAVFPHPGAPFFLPGAISGEAEYMNHSDSGSVGDKLTGQLVTSILAPQHKLLYNQPSGIMFSFQSMAPATISSGNIAYTAGLIALTVLLGLALLRIVRLPDRFAVGLLAIFGGQMVLHLIYGEETFLYSLHFAPLLVLLCAQAFRGKSDAACRLLLVFLILCSTWNNLTEFSQIMEEPFRGTPEFLYRLDL